MTCPDIPLDLFLFSGILNIVLGLLVFALTSLRRPGQGKP